MDGIHPGTYTIKNGKIEIPFLKDGQYFRIIDSVFNDGLHQYKAPKPPTEDTPITSPMSEDVPTPEEPPDPVPEESDLTDETFTGAIWALAIPKAIMTISAEISAWQEKYGGIAASPYLSESFAGYSYSKGTIGGSSGASDWKAVFRARLNPYRKLREV